MSRWLIPAVLFAVVIVGIVSTIQWTYHSDASNRSAGYARDAQDQIAAKCGVTLADQNCAREIEQTARANQRDEYDLYSQQAMALWTAVMGGVAVIGMALSGVVAYLVWKTWAETRRTADGAFEANRISRESSERQLRAYVEATKVEFVSRDGNKPPLIRITETNGGVTPAYNLRSYYQAITFLGVDRHFVPPVPEPPAMVASGSILGGASLISGIGLLNWNERIPKIRTGDAVMFIVGWIEYHDIMGKPHRTEIRYFIDHDTLKGETPIGMASGGNIST